MPLCTSFHSVLKLKPKVYSKLTLIHSIKQENLNQAWDHVNLATQKQPQLQVKTQTILHYSASYTLHYKCLLSSRIGQEVKNSTLLRAFAEQEKLLTLSKSHPKVSHAIQQIIQV